MGLRQFVKEMFGKGAVGPPARTKPYPPAPERSVDVVRTAPERKKKVRTCVDCGVSLADRGPAAKRCKPCARDNAKRRAKITFRQRQGKAGRRHCPDCGLDISGRHGLAQRCPPCAKEHRTRELRKARNKLSE